MNMWEALGNVAAAFLILVIVLAIIVAVMTATIAVIGIITAMKEEKQKKKMDALPDRMMEQAAAGLKEREDQRR